MLARFVHFVQDVFRKPSGRLGAALIFFKGLWDVVSALGNVDFIMGHVVPILEFLDSVWGTLVIVAVGLALIFRAATEPETTASATAPVPESQPNQDVEKLRRKLRRAEQERDRLREVLSDPTIKRRRDEEMLRGRCRQVAQKVRNFLHGYGSPYDIEQETIQRFKLRHEQEVTGLRNELEQQGWLTAQEYENLTLFTHDGVRKIERMRDTLFSISRGQ